MKTLNSTDFSSVGNKAAIRTKIINELNLDKYVQDFFFDPAHSDIKRGINLFVEAYPIESVQILNISYNGFGPGEVLLYFLCDNLTLSGYSSQIDTFVNSSPFAEVKAIQQMFEGVHGDFRFGGFADEANHAFLQDVRRFIDHTGNSAILPNELEISRRKITELRKIDSEGEEFNLVLKVVNGLVFVGNTPLCKRSDIDFSSKVQFALDNLSEKTPNTFSEIENKYFAKVLSTAVGQSDFLFFDRKTARCLYFGKIGREMLSIERVTQGRIKPYINLSYRDDLDK